MDRTLTSLYWLARYLATITKCNIFASEEEIPLLYLSKPKKRVLCSAKKPTKYS